MTRVKIGGYDNVLLPAVRRTVDPVWVGPGRAVEIDQAGAG